VKTIVGEFGKIENLERWKIKGEDGGGDESYTRMQKSFWCFLYHV